MSRRDDRVYYWLRAAEELERGDQAANREAAAVHYELAYRYGALAVRTDARIPRLRLVYDADAQIAA